MDNKKYSELKERITRDITAVKQLDAQVKEMIARDASLEELSRGFHYADAALHILIGSVEALLDYDSDDGQESGQENQE